MNLVRIHWAKIHIQCTLLQTRLIGLFARARNAEKINSFLHSKIICWKTIMWLVKSIHAQTRRHLIHWQQSSLPYKKGFIQSPFMCETLQNKLYYIPCEKDIYVNFWGFVYKNGDWFSKWKAFFLVHIYIGAKQLFGAKLV